MRFLVIAALFLTGCADNPLEGIWLSDCYPSIKSHSETAYSIVTLGFEEKNSTFLMEFFSDPDCIEKSRADSTASGSYVIREKVKTKDGIEATILETTSIEQGEEIADASIFAIIDDVLYLGELTAQGNSTPYLDYGVAFKRP